MPMGQLISTIEETEDGELFFEIPDELLESLGWGDGTVLGWEVVGQSIRLYAVSAESETE